MASKRPITPEGYARFEKELQRLWHEDRPKIVHEVAEAAAHGDRSENAEYIFGKKKLREIDRRMKFLSDLLERVQVVAPASNRKDTVDFGATVTFEDEEGRVRTVQIVGEDEVDAKQGRISMKSPVGRALLGRREGDEAYVTRPAGELEIVIQKIGYV
ncbi:MAG: transcription elongation factor GreB [Myxococcota bacterium]